MIPLSATVGYQPDWWQVFTSTIVTRALVAGTVVAIAAGAIGYFVVVRRDGFATHALAHIGLPGATGAVLVGLPVSFGLIVFCVVGGLGIGALGKSMERRDVATGTVLAFATALGVLFNSMATRSSGAITNILFGNLLAISSDQLVLFAVVAAAALAALAVIGRPLLFASAHPRAAEARGVPVRAVGVTFTVLLAVVVALAVQVVGTLLLFALVVTPAATALLITAQPAKAIALGTALALTAVWVGLALGTMWNLPPSFPIVTVALLCWLVALGITRRDRRAHFRGFLNNGQ